MPSARTALIIFGAAVVFLFALAPSAQAQEETGYFIDPSDATLIRKTQVPFASQVILSAADLPQKSSRHAAVPFSDQKFSYISESPDGRLLAFSVDGEPHDWTGILDLGTGAVRQLTLGFDARALNPSWSAEARFLVIEGEGTQGRRLLTLVDLTADQECFLDGRALRNKFLNVSDPWWSEKGNKIYFKAEVNNAFRRSLGLKPLRVSPKIGEADLQCRQTKLHPVSEFIAKYPAEILPGRLSVIGLKPSPTP